MRKVVICIAIAGFTQAVFAQENYIVQPGDTLHGIAIDQLQDINAWRKLCELNQIPDCNRITPGTRLLLIDSEDHSNEEDSLHANDMLELLEGESSGVGSPEESSKFSAAEQSLRGNHLTNSRFEGAQAGVVGAEGRVASGHSFFNNDTGALREIIDIGAFNGAAHIDIRIAGKRGNSIAGYRFSGDAEVTVELGQNWLGSFNVELLSGEIPEGVDIRAYIVGRNLDGDWISAIKSRNLRSNINNGEILEPPLKFSVDNPDHSAITIEIRASADEGAQYDYSLRLGSPELLLLE